MPQKLTSKTSFHLFILWSFIVLALSTCTPLTETPLIPPSPTQNKPPTPTIQPSPTPSIPVAMFIPPSDDYLDISDPIRSTLASLVSQEGWSFVEADSIIIEQLAEDIRVIVFFEPSPEIIDLASSTPGIQFVAIGAAGLEPLTNLSVIGPDGFRIDRQAFLAGYLSAILTDDWRIGDMVAVPPDLQPIIENSFRNGMTFYCGLCQIAYPPYNQYPIHTTLESESLEQDWLRNVEVLLSESVETVFLFSPEVNLPALSLLIDEGMIFLGTYPPPESIRSNWIATLRLAPEQVLFERWEQIISNEGGWTQAIPIAVEDVNQSLFSEGKQRFIDKVLLDLESGYIDPAVTPPAPVGN